MCATAGKSGKSSGWQAQAQGIEIQCKCASESVNLQETQLIKSLCVNKGVRSEVKLNMAKNIVVKRVIDEQSPN